MRLSWSLGIWNVGFQTRSSLLRLCFQLWTQISSWSLSQVRKEFIHLCYLNEQVQFACFAKLFLLCPGSGRFYVWACLRALLWWVCGTVSLLLGSMQGSLLVGSVCVVCCFLNHWDCIKFTVFLLTSMSLLRQPDYCFLSLAGWCSGLAGKWVVGARLGVLWRVFELWLRPGAAICLSYHCFNC